MKYMVMECHLSYAVVLDEAGKFLKVANRHYEVGQMVTDVIEMQVTEQETPTQPVKKKTYRWIGSLAAMAACLALVALPMLRMGQTPFASVYMSINPEVRIDVNRKDVVVGLEGTNADGDALIEQYQYKKKPLDLVMDELVDRAIETGFLHEGGQITLTLDAEDGEWVVDRGGSLSTHLNEHLREKMSVTIEVRDTQEKKHEVVIPVAPGNVVTESHDDMSGRETEPTYEESTGAAVVGSSGGGDSLYDDDDGQTDYGQSVYDGADDGQSRYDAPDDGQSAYDAPDDNGQSVYDAPGDDGQSVYDAPDDNGQSVYDAPGDGGQSEYDQQSNYDEPDDDDQDNDDD